MITKAEARLIRHNPNKVASIKFLREQYELRLYNAKQIVDAILATSDPID